MGNGCNEWIKKLLLSIYPLHPLTNLLPSTPNSQLIRDIR